jgi:hypothetical protein
VAQDAKLALAKDEEYIQSIISAADLKKRRTVKINEEASQQFEQLILGLD